MGSFLKPTFLFSWWLRLRMCFHHHQALQWRRRTNLAYPLNSQFLQVVDCFACFMLLVHRFFDIACRLMLKKSRWHFHWYQVRKFESEWSLQFSWILLFLDPILFWGKMSLVDLASIHFFDWLCYVLVSLWACRNLKCRVAKTMKDFKLFHLPSFLPFVTKTLGCLVCLNKGLYYPAL